MIDYEAGESCGYVCGIPRSAHHTEEHPWVASPATGGGLREAAREMVRALEAYREAQAHRGHPNEPHDREFHSIHHSPPCTEDDDCSRCASAEYGAEVDLTEHALPTLKARLATTLDPGEAE